IVGIVDHSDAGGPWRDLLQRRQHLADNRELNTSVWEETAALRNFDLVYVAFGVARREINMPTGPSFRLDGDPQRHCPRISDTCQQKNRQSKRHPAKRYGRRACQQHKGAAAKTK